MLAHLHTQEVCSLVKTWLTTIPYWIAQSIGQAYMLKKWDITAVNVHNIPKYGPVILAANHLRVVDSPLLAITTNDPPRRVTFLAKSEYFQIRSLKGLFVTIAFHAIGQISLNRAGGSDSAKGLAQAKSVLEDGGVLGIHVEGTRSPDGLLYDARAGFARLALETEATIVPVSITYQDDDPATGKHRVKIQFGKPLHYSEYKDKNIRDIAKNVTKSIQSMSGQTLAGRFAKIVSRFVGRKSE